MAKNLLLILLTVAVFVASTTGIGQALTVHTSDFINDSDRTHFNSFESFTDVASGDADYTYDGIRVYSVDGSGINNSYWSGDASLLDGSNTWYHNGGDYGYSVIKMADNSDFTNIGFHVSHGWSSGEDRYFSYELFNDGSSVASGSHYFWSSYLGFSDEIFDEIRIIAAREIPSFIGDGTYTGLALDAIEVATNSSPVPEPTTMVLFGIGILGLAGVSRRKK